MKCSHFGRCGSCSLVDLDYKNALNLKSNQLKNILEPFFKGEIEVFSSQEKNHRARAEFKIWHIEDKAFYAMSNVSKNGVEIINECPKVLAPIEQLMYPLLEQINKSEILKHKLFSIEFLAGLSNEVLVTLIYHKKLDSIWQEEAQKLQEQFGVFIIGRARKQKLVLSQEYITEHLDIEDKRYFYRYYEGGFTQPNPYINKQMVSWAKKRAKAKGDFLEAYCGLGNFTIPLSQNFDKVLATEISKNSIKAAKENCELNGVDNIEFIRLNASETSQALKKVRSFRRLQGINLDSYNFSTVLVDPPRAGLDKDSLNLIKDIDNIIYISCNPLTLARDLQTLSQTHRIVDAALFDQFPYTTHIESGVYLERI